MSHSPYVVPFLLVFAGCASSAPVVKSPVLPDPELDLAPVAQEAPPAAPQAAGDIQFTMTERRAKAAPDADDGSSPTSATTLQPLKASTSGVTTTGVANQHIHVRTPQ